MHMLLWQYLGALIINSLIMFFLARYFAEREAKLKKIILKRLKKNIYYFLDLLAEDLHNQDQMEYHSISREDYLTYKAQENMGYRYYLVEKFLIKINIMKVKELTTIDNVNSEDTSSKMVTKHHIAFFNSESASEANIIGLKSDIQHGLFDGILLSVLQQA